MSGNIILCIHSDLNKKKTNSVYLTGMMYIHINIWYLFYILFSFFSQSSDMRNSPKEICAFKENSQKFNGAKDVSRDFSNSQDNTDRGSMSDQAFACSASSVESLPSASGSSKYTTHAHSCPTRFYIVTNNVCLYGTLWHKIFGSRSHLHAIQLIRIAAFESRDYVHTNR